MQPDHVLVIMTDQQRADLTAREGFGVDCTPAVDRLAAEGCWFDHAYSSAPLCVPARISMLTGRYPSAHGVRENSTIRPRYDVDLVDVMRAGGYRTALIGKNHSHLTRDRLDHFVEYSHFGRRRSQAVSEDPELDRGASFDSWLCDLGFRNSMTAAPFPVEDQAPARLVDATIDWLDANRDGRTFSWLSIPEPHVPYQVSEPYFSTYTPDTVPPPDSTAADISERGFRWQHQLRQANLRGEDGPEVLLRARANYVGMIRLIDDQLGRLFDHLRDTGLLDRTMVVVLADHGDFAGEYGLLRKGGDLAEVLTRIPMVFAGAGLQPGAGKSAAHVSIVDVFPTLCEVIGQPIPAGVQGRSLVGVLTGDLTRDEATAAEFGSVYAEQGVGGLPYDAASPDEADRGSGNHDQPTDALNGVTMAGTRRMVRCGRWKIVIDAHQGVELHDLAADPRELRNLAADPAHAGDLARMTALLSTWLARATDPLPIPDDGVHRRRHPRNYAWSGVHQRAGDR